LYIASKTPKPSRVSQSKIVVLRQLLLRGFILVVFKIIFYIILPGLLKLPALYVLEGITVTSYFFLILSLLHLDVLMLTINNLTFAINERIFFRKFSITLLPSAIIYLQGKNGCGKSSLLKMIADVQQPTSGSIFYNTSIISELKKPYCTYLGHNLGLKFQLTVFENLKFWAETYDSVETLPSAIHYLNLYDILDKKCYTLSAGNLKKVALSRLIACHSNLWLLDEVEANLDHENKSLLQNLIISKANNNGIVIITSHHQISIKTAQTLLLQEYN